jgi:LysR family transcriptional regulator, mexEF-oprN operon transcriptional activator
MRPTARALNIAPVVRATLRQMEDIRWKEPLDPGRQDRTFHLGFSSDVELLVMPGLTAQLRRVAPEVRLLGRQAERAEVHRLLDEKELDIAGAAPSPEHRLSVVDSYSNRQAPAALI